MHELSPLGMFRVLLLFGILWWMYGGFAWLTNTMAPSRWSHRLLLLVGMAGFMVVALATPRAFDGDGVAWGLGYLVVVNFRQLSSPVWTAALLVPNVTPYIVTPGRFDIQPAHMVERYGLALLITLGESVVAVGVAVSGQALTAGTVAAVMLGLALAATLWWTYFGGDDERAEVALTAAAPDRRAALTLAGYFYATIPIVLGVVTIAAGLKLSIGHAADPLPPGPAVALASGAALFLGGAAALRRALGIGPIGLRLAGALLALPTIALGTWAAATAQLAALVALLAAVLVLERLREERSQTASHLPPGGASRSATVNVPGRRAAMVGRQPGSAARYEPGSASTMPSSTSPTITAPTSPRRSPSSLASASLSR